MKIPPEAFDFYVSLGHTRTYQQVADKYGVSRRGVQKVADRDDWGGRLDEIEREAQERSDKALSETVAEIRVRHLKMLKGMAGRAVKAISEHPLNTGMEGMRAAEIVIKLDGARLTVAELIQRADQARTELWDLFLELAVGADGKPHAGRLGKWLSRNADRVVDGRSIQRAGVRYGSVLWQLTTRKPRGMGGIKGLVQTTREKLSGDENDILIDRAETSPQSPPSPLSQPAATANGTSGASVAAAPSVEDLARNLFGAREVRDERWEH
jgi:hypothetical protein